MANAKPQPQLGLDEQPLQNTILASMLDDREGAKEEMAPYRTRFQNLDKAVKGLIEQAELKDGMYRCGGFVITIKDGEEKHVEFDRGAARRVSIRPAKT